MAREGEVSKSAQMTIRVFWSTSPVYSGEGLETISTVFKVSYIEKLDPIYHELCFIDMEGKRHQFVGLPYWVQESMEESCGVDAQV